MKYMKRRSKQIYKESCHFNNKNWKQITKYVNKSFSKFVSLPFLNFYAMILLHKFQYYLKSLCKNLIG